MIYIPGVTSLISIDFSPAALLINCPVTAYTLIVLIFLSLITLINPSVGLG